MSRALALAGSTLLVKFSRTVIVDADGNLIAEAENRRERDKDHSTCRNSGSTVNWLFLQNWHLNQCTLYVTLPCPMCAGAIVQHGWVFLVYGADDRWSHSYCCQHS